MASTGFRRRFRRPRFSRPVAHKKLLWVTQALTGTEVATVPTHFDLVSSTQWILNATSGNFENAKILRLVLIVQAQSIATNETRIFGLSVDDQNQSAINPAGVNYYQNTEPFHVGVLSVPATAAPNVFLSNNYPDNVRTFKVNRKIESDETLQMWIQPATAAGNQLTFSILARALVQLD